MRPSSSPLGEYLRARREQVQPEDVGLPRSPGRRVPGLRREEVARLSDISSEYYLRIEQGRDRHPSEPVLRSLGRTLRLDDDGLSYLFRIARPSPQLHAVRDPEPVGDSVHRLLGQWTRTPAYVTDANLDVLASNRLAQRVAPGYLVPGTNLLEAAFDQYTMSMTMGVGGTPGLADAATSTAPGDRDAVEQAWRLAFREQIGSLRYNGDPDDPRLQEIVGRLSTRHLLFRSIWAEHDVLRPTSGTKRHVIDPYGWVTFSWQTLGIPRAPRHFLTTYFAEPGSRTERVFAELSARRESVDVAAGGVESMLVLRRGDGESRDERAS